MTNTGEPNSSRADAYLKACHAQTQLRNELSVRLPETEMPGTGNLRPLPRHSLHFLWFNHKNSSATQELKKRNHKRAVGLVSAFPVKSGRIGASERW